jgi:flagellar assembly factor FliW
MIYQSTRLGAFDLKDEDILHFPEGLFGFENEKKFVLLPLSPKIESPMQWLHSLSNPDLTFVVTDPHLYLPDYKLFLTEDDKRVIRLDFGAEVVVLIIITIPANPMEMTGNLVAPIVINLQKRVAKQFVLTNPEYDTRHPLLAPAPTGKKSRR